MKKNELIEFLQRQIEYLQGQLDEALASVSSLTLSNEKLQSTSEKLVATVDELRKQMASMEEAMKGKSAELSKEKAARQAVQASAELAVGASGETGGVRLFRNSAAAEATEETHQQRCQKKDSSGMRGRDRCSGAGQPRLQSGGGNVHRRVRRGALRHGADALQENNLQGQKICSGREDIQRLRPPPRRCSTRSTLLPL